MLTRRKLLTLAGVAVATWSWPGVGAVARQKKDPAPKLTEVTLTISGMT